MLTADENDPDGPGQFRPVCLRIRAQQDKKAQKHDDKSGIYHGPAITGNRRGIARQAVSGIGIHDSAERSGLTFPLDVF